MNEDADIVFAWRRDTYEGEDGGLKAVSIRGNFEMIFLDHNKSRQWDISEAAISNKDEDYLRGALARLTPEFKAFILEAAELLLKSGKDQR